MNIAQIIDHTLLNPAAVPAEIERLCKEAVDYGFFSVCVNPSYVSYANNFIKQIHKHKNDVKITTVVGFPLGASTLESKCFEAKDAVKNGADEIDMVINIGRLKNGDISYVRSEIAAVKNCIGQGILKVILETCLLTKEEIATAAELAVGGGADFVKTSTGFSAGGALKEDVELIAKTVSGRAGVKASGGIRTYEAAIKMINAGANRLGLSNSVMIMQEYDKMLNEERK